MLDTKTQKEISLGFTAFLLPLLILFTSFLLFLEKFAYDLAHLEVVIGLGIMGVVACMCWGVSVAGGRIVHGIIISGLIMFFLDIQYHWASSIGGVVDVALMVVIFVLTGC